MNHCLKEREFSDGGHFLHDRTTGISPWPGNYLQAKISFHKKTSRAWNIEFPSLLSQDKGKLPSHWFSLLRPCVHTLETGRVKILTVSRGNTLTVLWLLWASSARSGPLRWKGTKEYKPDMAVSPLWWGVAGGLEQCWWAPIKTEKSLLRPGIQLPTMTCLSVRGGKLCV